MYCYRIDLPFFALVSVKLYHLLYRRLEEFAEFGHSLGDLANEATNDSGNLG
jgi:hypothetical protein